MFVLNTFVGGQALVPLSSLVRVNESVLLSFNTVFDSQVLSLQMSFEVSQIKYILVFDGHYSLSNLY